MRELLSKNLKEYNVILILTGIVIVAFFGVPFFRSPDNLFNLLPDLSMYGILAVGLTFVLISGEVDLSIGMSVAMSTITCAFCASKVNAAAGIAAAILTSLIISAIIAVLTTKIRMNSLIASIALLTTIQGLGYIAGNGDTIPVTNDFIRSLYNVKLFGMSFLTLPTVIFVVVLITGGIILNKTRFGNRVFVAGGNAEAGYMAGINIGRTKFICFLICGLLGGIMAVLMTSFVFCGAVSYGEGLNLTMISACVVGGVKFTGGKGGVIRTLLGISVMRIIVNVTSLLSLAAWAQSTITGVILILVLILDRYSRIQREEDII